VPPTAERNKADQKLLKADNAIRRYAEIRTNMKTVMAVFIPVSASLFLPVLVQLTLNFSSTNLLTVFLSLVLVGFLISVWSLMFIYFLFRPELKAKRACRLIRRAPLHAPKNRFIEYEVRSLLMLNNYMSRRMQIKHIRKLREISQTDLYNPWLNKIKSLRYYEESQFTESHGSKGISNNLLLLIPLLGPLLLLLISLVNN
ncbi:MAG: hypothetical protein EBV15_08475, partial [Bacteroidetes bacterium]|nr:hypothetical protein [Bacteroidota bacterium]